MNNNYYNMNNNYYNMNNSVIDPSNILISIFSTVDGMNMPTRMIYNNTMMEYLNELQNTTIPNIQNQNQNQNQKSKSKSKSKSRSRSIRKYK